MFTVMNWMGLPVNFQAKMFDDLAPLDERAYDAGALAAACNRSVVTIAASTSAHTIRQCGPRGEQ